MLLGSVKKILKEKPKTKFIIAGEGWHRSELQKISKEMKIEDKVFFTGYLPEEDFLAFFNVSDILVIPSTYEPFGIVALEGMATRTPIIVSDVGGLSEIVDHRWTGIKVPPDNSTALAEAIIDLIDNEKLKKTVVKNAMEKLIHVYDWSIIADQTIKIYNKVFKDWSEHNWKTKANKKRQLNK